MARPATRVTTRQIPVNTTNAVIGVPWCSSTRANWLGSSLIQPIA